ncbi:splicing factor [Encephalitozoon intestinalis ATCC 50506]|uniref:Splicing factor n=1 Tax=Encephalitozoon intestinalis (strain ATCC 50506) TaxID=876142 RepID=E0S9D1_ENCIT|nr:splicing factor [Encephalitozoon intestinalis ATCC 50506]ADM12195.1 splicing factor [Encephalitozoon intestinalis ATCC 50506]UTX46002.1 WW domain-containing protein [Encephalitozoon intestinalis]
MEAKDAKVDYEVLVAPDGKTYYYNKKTGKSSFRKPDVLKDSDEDFDVDPWIECRSRQGKVFYHNTITKESRWERPGEKRKGKTLIKGIGMNMRITDHETSKYLLYRLMEQYKVENMKDVFYKLSTEPIFRAIRMDVRESLVRKYFEDKEENNREEEVQRQKYYVDEVCKVDVGVSDFFGFNSVFSRHPYYSRIKDKFGCYEVYIEKHMGGTTAGKLEEIFRACGIDLNSSASDVLKMKEMEGFDRKVVLFSFIRYFRRLEREFLLDIEKKKTSMAEKIPHYREEFRQVLNSLYSRGLIYYKMKFKDAFYLFKNSEPFWNLLGSMESPKEVYFEFVNDLENKLKRYEKERTEEISQIDKRAVDKYFEVVWEEKEEGEI